MIRMEIALFFVLCLVAIMYFTGQRKNNPLHQTFSVLLIIMLIHMFADGITIYTVNHLETVNPLLNEIIHRIFIGTMIIAVYLFYKYIALLVQQETNQKKNIVPAQIILVSGLFCSCVLPMYYVQTPQGNYSYGLYVACVYVCVILYLILCTILLIQNRKQLPKKEKIVIGFALLIEFAGCVIQGFFPLSLISGMGLTLMTLSFFLTLENPAYLQAQLVEQKMSMLYLKSQINPHFLYNTLDTIRIQAQLNQDKQVADLLMRLVDFFRNSVKVNRQMVALDDELDLLEAYMELMCYRYPQIEVEYDIDPELGDALVPNFILQPIVENSLLHGLKNMGYKGKVSIRAFRLDDKYMEIIIQDTGSGFKADQKKQVDDMLNNYDKHSFKLEGNSIGLLNVQKRIKLLCGKECGLSYVQESQGVSAHLVLNIQKETV